MNRDKIVSARITENEYESLKEMAKMRGVKISDLIRDLIVNPPQTVDINWWKPSIYDNTINGGTYTVANDVKWVTING